MIINIPLQIDEAAFEQKVNDDYTDKVEQLLLQQVEKVLKDHDDRYYGSTRDPKLGLSNIVYNRIDNFLKEHKEEIIEAASGKLAERLSKTKKAKELLNEKDNS